ncbi:unnamed protein product [Amoebophrya sp. A120]|nr:unnamed protein product [Amoebophrya sp. A120]|eukprot:GSA120T00003932001.1
MPTRYLFANGRRGAAHPDPPTPAVPALQDLVERQDGVLGSRDERNRDDEMRNLVCGREVVDNEDQPSPHYGKAEAVVDSKESEVVAQDDTIIMGECYIDHNAVTKGNDQEDEDSSSSEKRTSTSQDPAIDVLVQAEENESQASPFPPASTFSRAVDSTDATSISPVVAKEKEKPEDPVTEKMLEKLQKSVKFQLQKANTVFTRTAFLNARDEYECVEVEEIDNQEARRADEAEQGQVHDGHDNPATHNFGFWFLQDGKPCFCCPPEYEQFGKMLLNKPNHTTTTYTVAEATLFEDQQPINVPFFDEYYISNPRVGRRQCLNKEGEVLNFLRKALQKAVCVDDFEAREVEGGTASARKATLPVVPGQDVTQLTDEQEEMLSMKLSAIRNLRLTQQAVQVLKTVTANRYWYEYKEHELLQPQFEFVFVPENDNVDEEGQDLQEDNPESDEAARQPTGTTELGSSSFSLNHKKDLARSLQPLSSITVDLSLDGGSTSWSLSQDSSDGDAAAKTKQKDAESACPARNATETETLVSERTGNYKESANTNCTSTPMLLTEIVDREPQVAKVSRKEKLTTEDEQSAEILNSAEPELAQVQDDQDQDGSITGMPFPTMNKSDELPYFDDGRSTRRLRDTLDMIFRDFYDKPVVYFNEPVTDPEDEIAKQVLEASESQVVRLFPLERQFLPPSKNFLAQKRDLHFKKWPLLHRLVCKIYLRKPKKKASRTKISGRPWCGNGRTDGEEMLTEHDNGNENDVSESEKNDSFPILDVHFEKYHNDKFTLLDAHCHLEIIWRKLPFRVCEQMTDRVLMTFHPESPYSLPNAWQLKTITSVCDGHSLDFWEKYCEEVYFSKISTLMDRKMTGDGGAEISSSAGQEADTVASEQQRLVFDDHLYFSIGVHPKSMVEYLNNERNMQERMLLLADKLQAINRLVAWGECGLDYDADLEVPDDLPEYDRPDDIFIEKYERDGDKNFAEFFKLKDKTDPDKFRFWTKAKKKADAAGKNAESFTCPDEKNKIDEEGTSTTSAPVVLLDEAGEPLEDRNNPDSFNWEGRLGMHKRVPMRNLVREQLRESVKRGLPVVLHSRGADVDMFRILKEEVPLDTKIHLHCWSSGGVFLKELLDTFPNLKIGIAGHLTTPSADTWLTHPFAHSDAENYEPLRKNITDHCPLSRLVVETDAPYMPPIMPEEANMSYELPNMSAVPSMSCATVRYLCFMYGDYVDVGEDEREQDAAQAFDAKMPFVDQKIKNEGASVPVETEKKNDLNFVVGADNADNAGKSGSSSAVSVSRASMSYEQFKEQSRDNPWMTGHYSYVGDSKVWRVWKPYNFYDMLLQLHKNNKETFGI